MLGLLTRYVNYLRWYGLEGSLLFLAKALYLVLHRVPRRVRLVSVREGYSVLAVPGDLGISSELLSWGSHEPFFTRLLLERLGRGIVVIDIGSNIGYYAFLEALAVGSKGLVVAVEPQPHVFKALLAGVKLNGLGNILPLRLAISRRHGNVRMVISRFSNWSRVLEGNDPAPDFHAIHEVEGVSVDDLVDSLGLKRVDLIRMDVEGYETEVLEGAWRTLERFRPRICLELHVYNIGLRESIRLLARILEKGYRIDFASPRLIDVSLIWRRSHAYAVKPSGDAGEQLIQIFRKPYMLEVIHTCLSPSS